MSARRRCRTCRYWARYPDDDGHGECVLAENASDVSLHVLGLRAMSGPGGPAVAPPGRVLEIPPGTRVAAVLVTDGAFGCASHDATGADERDLIA